mgnify:CR=1 FL=1
MSGAHASKRMFLERQSGRFTLLVGWIELELIHHGAYLGIFEQNVKMMRKEIADADCLYGSFAIQMLKCPLGIADLCLSFNLMSGADWPMNQIEVEIVGSETSAAALERTQGLIAALIVVPEFARDEEAFARGTAFLDSLSHHLFVVIRSGSIDMAKTEFEIPHHGFLSRLVGWRLVGAIAYAGNPDAIGKLIGIVLARQMNHCSAAFPRASNVIRTSSGPNPPSRICTRYAQAS